MNMFQRDSDYIKAITANPALETIFMNMQGQGLAVTMKKR
jgi:hypothetical protein